MSGEPPRKMSRTCKTMPSKKYFDYTSDYDRILVAGKKNFFVSSKDLAPKFTYFRCLFEGNFIERSKNTIHLQDVSSQSLELFLTAAENPKQFKVTRSRLTALIEIASFFNAPELVLEIISFPNNSEKFARIDLLQIADECVFPELRNQVEHSFLSGLNDNIGERFYYFGIAMEYGLEKVTSNILDWLMSCSDSSCNFFMGKVLAEKPQVGMKMIKNYKSGVFFSDTKNVVDKYRRITQGMSDVQFSSIKAEVESYFLKIFKENEKLLRKLSLIVKDSHLEMMETVKDLTKQVELETCSSSSSKV